MEKILSKECMTKEMLDKAKIKSEYVKASCKRGSITISEFNLKCVQCGCDDESKLVIRNGVHICTSCINGLKDMKCGGKYMRTSFIAVGICLITLQILALIALIATKDSDYMQVILICDLGLVFAYQGYKSCGRRKRK